jgi:hypothetical protein
MAYYSDCNCPTCEALRADMQRIAEEVVRDAIAPKPGPTPPMERWDLCPSCGGVRDGDCDHCLGLGRIFLGVA